MLFLLISIIVPVITYTMLPLVIKADGAKARKYAPLLLLGCVLFFTSWYLPSPLIDGRNTAFMTHVIGGGVFSGCLWLYAVKVKQWQFPNIWVEAVSLYALVSSLGVINELAELAFVQFGLTRLALTDTSWDLFANTFGALIFYGAYKLINMLVKKHGPRS